MLFDSKKLYEILKLNIENLNARVENNEWQIKQLTEKLEEIKKLLEKQASVINEPTTPPKAYAQKDGVWYEIDPEGKLKQTEITDLETYLKERKE